MTELLIDLRRKTLELNEPGIRLIDADTGEHVATVLPDSRGRFDHVDTERDVATRCRR